MKFRAQIQRRSAGAAGGANGPRHPGRVSFLSRLLSGREPILFKKRGGCQTRALKMVAFNLWFPLSCPKKTALENKIKGRKVLCGGSGLGRMGGSEVPNKKRPFHQEALKAPDRNENAGTPCHRSQPSPVESRNLLVALCGWVSSSF